MPPVNDNFANAITLTGPSGSTSMDNTGATVESGEPNGTGVHNYNSIWYKWTAPTSGGITFKTLGSTDSGGGALDTTLTVWTGTALNNLVEVAVNDDNPDTGDYTSIVHFSAIAGVTYYIQAATYNFGDSGIVLVTWEAYVYPSFNHIQFGNNLDVIDQGGGNIRVDAGGSLAVYDEGVLVTPPMKKINFVGGGVSVSLDFTLQSYIIGIPDGALKFGTMNQGSYLETLTQGGYGLNGYGHFFRSKSIPTSYGAAVGILNDTGGSGGTGLEVIAPLVGIRASSLSASSTVPTGSNAIEINQTGGVKGGIAIYTSKGFCISALSSDATPVTAALAVEATAGTSILVRWNGVNKFKIDGTGIYMATNPIIGAF
jgi:hypothetical protein